MASHSEHNSGESASTSALSACIRFILGGQLANREVRGREIGAIEGVPALGLDGLSSTAGSGADDSLRRGGCGSVPSRPLDADDISAAWHLVHFVLANHRGISEKRWRLYSVAGIEQLRVDATAIPKLLKNPLGRLFGKASLAGAPDDYGNYGHGSLSLNAQWSVERRRPADARQSSLVIAPRPAQEGTNLVPEHTKVTVELANRRRLMPCLQFARAYLFGLFDALTADSV
jgi:hypothetical protein